MWKKANDTKYEFRENNAMLAILFVERIRSMQKGKHIISQRVVLSIKNNKGKIVGEQLIAVLPVDKEHRIREEHLIEATKSLNQIFN